MKSSAGRILISLVPITVLVVFLALDISIFGSDSILGPSQVALIAASAVCVFFASWLFKTPWKDFEDAIKGNISDVASALVILLLIGAVSGTWTMSGVVPAFIYYGVQLISPRVFLLTACFICAVVSLMTGSSWTTIATIGVALLGIGKAEGFSDGMIAGAIISGAYFGDKISPLSDTTVMASSINQVPLFTHIRYMLYTTGPTMVITLIIFTILGLSHSQADSSQIDLFREVLSAKFHIPPWLMLVPLVTMLGGSLPGLFAGALITETLYSIPGIGYVSYQSMVAGDIPFSMFYLVFMAVLTLLGNLISDILYAVVDPRVRVN